MKKKVAVLLNYPLRERESYLVNDLKVLQKIGYELTVYSLSFYNTESNQLDKSFSTTPSGARGSRLYNYLYAPFLVIKTLVLNPSLIKRVSLNDISTLGRNHRLLSNAHKYNFIYLGYGSTLENRENLFRLVNKKVLVSFRGNDASFQPYLSPNYLTPYITQKTFFFHFISNDLKIDLSKHFPIEKRQCFTIKQHIDFGFSLPPSKPSGKLKIINVGHLEWNKDHKTFLHVLYTLKKRGLLFDAEIIGSGSYKNILLYLIDQLNLSKEITITPTLPHKEFLIKLSQKDYLIHTSIREGFCQVVAEAQALGKIVISTNSQGIKENIIDKQTGFIVDLMDSKKIADLIEHIEQNPTLKCDISLKAQGLTKKRTQEHAITEWKKMINFINNDK